MYKNTTNIKEVRIRCRMITQPSEDIRKGLRPTYSNNADSLTAASQVIAIHFQTIAAANNYWRTWTPLYSSFR